MARRAARAVVRADADNLHALIGDDRYSTAARADAGPGPPGAARGRGAIAPATHAATCSKPHWRNCAASGCATPSSAPGMRSAGPQHSAAKRDLDEAQAYLDALAGIEAETPGCAARPGSTVRRVARAVRTVPAAPGDARRTADDSQGQGPAVRYRHRARTRAPWSQRRRAAAALAETAGASTAQSRRRARLRSSAPGSNPLYAWLERLERDKLNHERRRLLYVAATRAETFGCTCSAPARSRPTRRRANCRCASQLRALRSSCYGPKPAVRDAFSRRLAEVRRDRWRAASRNLT